MKSFLIALLALVISATTFAQDKPALTKPFEFGIYGGVNYNFHSPNFSDNNHSITFSNSTTSMGFNIGGFADYEINKNMRLSGRLGIHGIGAELTQDNVLGGKTTLNSNITMLEFSPAVKITELFKESPAYVIAGFEFGSRLVSDYSINVGDSLGQSDTSTLFNSIPETNNRYAVYIGAGIPIHAFGTTFTPEITYRKSLGDFSNLFKTWNIDQLRIGISVTLGPAKQKAKKVAVEQAPQNAGLIVGYYDDGGNFAPLGPGGVKVEDIQFSELYPLAPFVFFAQNNDKPDASFQILNSGDARGQFSLETLPQDAMEINKRTMDIIGARMRENADASLTCIGSIDGKSESKTKGLANRRAENVKSYLVSKYGISPERISTESRALPEVPSAINEKDGMSENRRVTFKSNNPSILEPLSIRGDETRWAKPEMLEFRPTGDADSNVASWALTVSQADRVLREFVGVGSPSAQRWVIRPNELSQSQVPIDYTLSTTDKNGVKSDTLGSVPVEYYSSLMNPVESRPDMTVSKFSLILFDFDKSDISEENAAILYKYVAPAIKGNSTVKIYGYTDRIGPDQYNKTLATQRANTVRDILQTKSPDSRYEVFGRGEEVEIFDNSIPPGRILSRTVQIIVETPR